MTVINFEYKHDDFKIHKHVLAETPAFWSDSMLHDGLENANEYNSGTNNQRKGVNNISDNIIWSRDPQRGGDEGNLFYLLNN